MSAVRRILRPAVVHSALRFALSICVADALVWSIFRDGTPVVMGSFAVICLLYFLDYDGTARERLIGYGSAAGVGLVAITLGTVMTAPLALAVGGALLVSFAFAYARVLRGYVARAAVGLQGAFFLPLMADVPLAELPAMLGAWAIGSTVAIAAGLIVLPHHRPGIVREHVRQWLERAADCVGTTLRGGDVRACVAGLEAATSAVDAAMHAPDTNPGIVGRRERALSHLVDGTHWGLSAFALLAPSAGPGLPEPTRTLLSASEEALACGARALTDTTPPASGPDLAALRRDDLSHLPALSADELQQHYPARLVSILAMRMMWLAGLTRGLRYPTPDLGSTQDRAPLSVLRLNLGPRSVWFMNALRTGAATAACVLLVRTLGLEHGLWVVLAALSVTQVSFSATANGLSSVKIAAGALAGVAFAGLGTLLHLPHLAYVVLLPVLAFLAVVATQMGGFTSQFLYTPFALANLVVLEWTTDQDLEVTRLENIALGAAVAGVFALAVFPFGLVRQLRRQAAAADDASRRYLDVAIEAAQTGEDAADAPALRRDCMVTASMLESTLAADAVCPSVASADIRQARDVDSRARDRVIGGDACVQLARERQENPALAPAVSAIADWWRGSPLLAVPRPPR